MKGLKLTKMAVAGLGLVMSTGVMAGMAGSDVGFKVAGSGDQWVNMTGLVQFDHVMFDDDGTKTNAYQSSSNIRRAQLGLHGGLGQEFSFAIRTELSEDYSDAAADQTKRTDLREAYVAYHGLDNATFKVGQILPMAGLDNSTHQAHGVFMERSLPALAFRPEYRIGFAADYTIPEYNAKIAVAYVHNADKVPADSGEASPTAWSTRLTYAPLMDDSMTVHTGLHYLRSEISTTDTVTFSAVPELTTAEATAYSATLYGTGANGDLTEVRNYEETGLEMAFQMDNLLLQGEFFSLKINRDGANAARYFNGYSVQASYSWGGQRHYDMNTGTFGGMDTSGAWEVAARHSMVDLYSYSVGSTSQGAQSNTTIGVNYFVNSNVSVQANYVDMHIPQASTTRSYDLDAVGLRVQMMF